MTVCDVVIDARSSVVRLPPHYYHYLYFLLYYLLTCIPLPPFRLLTFPQSSIMTVFRLPLNLLVVLGTKLTSQANDIPSLQWVFAVTAGMHGVAMVLQVLLQWVQVQAPRAGSSPVKSKGKSD